MCGHRNFGHDAFPTQKTRLVFYVFENGFGVPTYFIFFKGKKRKKTLNVTHNRKNKSVKTESRFGGQVTY